MKLLLFKIIAGPLNELILGQGSELMLQADAFEKSGGRGAKKRESKCWDEPASTSAVCLAICRAARRLRVAFWPLSARCERS